MGSIEVTVGDEGVQVKRPGWGSYVLAILFPIVGVILAIIQYARGNAGPATALLLTSIVAFFVWFTILASVAANDYNNCINNAHGYAQQLNC